MFEFFTTASVDAPIRVSHRQAYKRLRKLLDVLTDINPAISEISEKYFSTDYSILWTWTKKLSIETNLGVRFLVIEKEAIRYGTLEEVTKHWIDHSTGKDELKEGKGERFKQLYRITLNSNNESVDIEPNMTINAPMNEKQIYDSICEIEKIIGKYDFATKSEEHKKNVNFFAMRFV